MDKNNKEKLEKIGKKIKRLSNLRTLSPFIPAVPALVLSAIFIYLPVWPILIPCVLFTLETILLYIQKSIFSTLMNKKLYELEDMFNEISEDVGYLIQDEDGKYVNKEYLEYQITNAQTTLDDVKYRSLFNNLINKYYQANPGEFLDNAKEINGKLQIIEKPKKVDGEKINYSISTMTDRTLVIPSKKGQSIYAKEEPVVQNFDEIIGLK